MPPTSTKQQQIAIRRVTMATGSLDLELAWWHEQLGFPLVAHDAGSFEVLVGSSSLKLIADQSGRRAPSQHLAIEVLSDDLIEAATWLASASDLIASPNGYQASTFTVEPRTDDPDDLSDQFEAHITSGSDSQGHKQLDVAQFIVDFPAWNAHSVYAVSPGGHVIELIARHNRVQEWRDGSGGPEFVVGLSEVGILAPDVAQLQDRLEECGIQLWFGDPQSGFCACGAESGLLICSRERRWWFPTQIEGVAGSLTIELANVQGLPPGKRRAVGSQTLLVGV